jgi:predicted RNase H-like HicB family nuclease
METKEHGGQSPAVRSPDEAGEGHSRGPSQQRSGNRYGTLDTEAGRIETMTEYAVVLEKTGNGWSAYVPDLDGCIAAGDTEAETLQLIREAIALHIEAMRQDGDPIPEPTTHVEYVRLAS